MHPDLPDRLASRLAGSLPGSRAQARLQPELSYGRHFHTPPERVRQAAVMILLVPDGDGWRLPLVVRPQSMTDHAGQISLPGGVIEENETDRQAALRELHEELGVDPAAPRVLGRLSPLYLFVTNYRIAPWIASLDAPPRWRLSAAEVDHLVHLPLGVLTSPASRGHHTQTKLGVPFTAPHIRTANHLIWGATAMILAELTTLVLDVNY